MKYDKLKPVKTTGHNLENNDIDLLINYKII